MILLQQLFYFVLGGFIVFFIIGLVSYVVGRLFALGAQRTMKEKEKQNGF